jgi:thioesterase domain-containing protein/acyl carrier protein
MARTPRSNSSRPEDVPALSALPGSPAPERILVRPKVVVARRLREIWKAILDLDEVGARDDFFEQGGDSLAATALMAEIELAFGVKLPISMLLEAQTIVQLTDRVLAVIGETESPLLIPIEPGGDRTPIFFVHGLHGQVLFTRHLRGQLGEGRPLFGLQGRTGPRPGGEAETVAEIAADYVAAVRAARPGSRLILAGYCAGALIAWEMAQQLTELGEPPEAVIGIDPPVLLQGDVGGPANAPEGTYGSPQAFRDEARQMIAGAARQHADPRIIGRGDDALERAVDRAERMRLILNRYQPAPWTGEVAFICSAPRVMRLKEPHNPWRPVLPRSIRLYAVGDGHLELFRDRGKLVAQSLRRYLEELEL